VVGDPRGAHAAPDGPRSRRALLTGGAAAATAALLSACSGAAPLREKVRGGETVAKVDVAPLNALLAVEQYAIAAYAAAIPLLHSPQSDAAIRFLAHELAHSVALEELIKRVKGKPGRPRASYDLGRPRTAPEVIALLKHVEQTQIRSYLATLPHLQGPGSRLAAVSIMANEAQHQAVLRWQSGESPTPTALVNGS
jgi:Ferritin-like domain